MSDVQTLVSSLANAVENVYESTANLDNLYDGFTLTKSYGQAVLSGIGNDIALGGGIGATVLGTLSEVGGSIVSTGSAVLTSLATEVAPVVIGSGIGLALGIKTSNEFYKTDIGKAYLDWYNENIEDDLLLKTSYAIDPLGTAIPILAKPTVEKIAEYIADKFIPRIDYKDNVLPRLTMPFTVQSFTYNNKYTNQEQLNAMCNQLFDDLDIKMTLSSTSTRNIIDDIISHYNVNITDKLCVISIAIKRHDYGGTSGILTDTLNVTLNVYNNVNTPFIIKNSGTTSEGSLAYNHTSYIKGYNRTAVTNKWYYSTSTTSSTYTYSSWDNTYNEFDRVTLVGATQVSLLADGLTQIGKLPKFKTGIIDNDYATTWDTHKTTLTRYNTTTQALEDVDYMPIPYTNVKVDGTDYVIDYPTDISQDIAQNPSIDVKGLDNLKIGELIDSITQAISKANTDTVAITDTATIPNTGSTPTIVIPPSVVNGMVSLYSPTDSQLRTFSGWLWSSYEGLVQKLFQDPMQAIISLHKIYCTPSLNSGTEDIVLGKITATNCPSRTVSEQYITLDCGTITINETFGNVLDYEPYTKVQMYLPFIGIVTLNTNDIMRSKVNVTYKIDTLTGSCVAFIKVQKDSMNSILYQFNGNASVSYPISSANYSSIATGLISTAFNIAGAVATGGASIPLSVATVGSTVNALSRGISVERSGNLGSNYGAMCNKKPYVIISKPVSYLADGYNNLMGFPSNMTVKLKSCSGLTKVKNVHINDIDNATNNEKSMIEQILKDGIIL